MNLADKITSFDDLKDALIRPGTRVRDYLASDSSYIYVSSMVPPFLDQEPGRMRQGARDTVRREVWWLAREWMRIHYGIYPAGSDTLAWISKQQHIVPYALHVSREDVTKVAYTEDARAGEADRQTRTTLGRFLRKFFPLWTDKYIQDLEALHRADMSDEFELVPGDQISDLYQTGGLSSCMAHDSAYYGLPDGMHPTQVYDTVPGLHMAVLRKPGANPDEEDSLRSRCLVWINPKNPNDKRAVRVYGDTQVLTKRLERAGYVFKALDGAVLPQIPVTERRDGGNCDNQFLMPYMDSPHGNGGADGSYALRMSDGTFLLLSEAQKARIASTWDTSIQGPSPLAGARSSGGTTTCAGVFPAEQLTYRCEWTGQVHEALEDPSIQLWYDGQAHTVCAEVLRSHTVHTAKQFVRLGGDDDAKTTVRVHALDADESGNYPGTFVCGDGLRYIDDTRTRAQRNWHRLSPRYYEAGEWVRMGGGSLAGRGLTFASEINPETGAWAGDELIRTEDAVRLVRPENPDFVSPGCATVVRTVHKAAVPAGALRTADYDGRKAYVCKEHAAMVVRTDTGRKVVPGVHEVIRLFDGTWTYTRNRASIDVLGRWSVVVHKDDRDTAPTTPQFLAHLQGLVRESLLLWSDPVKGAIEILERMPRLTTIYNGSCLNFTERMEYQSMVDGLAMEAQLRGLNAGELVERYPATPGVTAGRVVEHLALKAAVMPVLAEVLTPEALAERPLRKGNWVRITRPRVDGEHPLEAGSVHRVTATGTDEDGNVVRVSIEAGWTVHKYPVGSIERVDYDLTPFAAAPADAPAEAASADAQPDAQPVPAPDLSLAA
jgi:hypothetical protein